MLLEISAKAELAAAERKPFQIADPGAGELLGVVWLAAMDGQTVSTPVSVTMRQTGFSLGII